MSETSIKARNDMVVYTLPPDIAGSLAEILAHEGTHYRNGEDRPVARYDRGWLEDAQRLAELSDALIEEGT